MNAKKVIFLGNQDEHIPTEKTDSPLVSFVIPTLNSEKTLEKCLNSISRQDYPSIEILIIDGGSIDNTIKIAQKFNAKIHVFKGPLGDARKLGFEISYGELIGFWDSDIYLPNSKWLSKSVKVLQQFPKASTLWIRSKPPLNSGIVTNAYEWYSWSIMLDFAKKGIGFWGGGGSIFRKKAVMEVGGIDKGTDTGEDFNLAKKFMINDYEVLYYNDPIFHDSHSSIKEIITKDVRRVRNFKKIGFSNSTGIPLFEFVKTNLEIGLLQSMRCFITKKKAYYGIVPIIIFLRTIIYTVTNILPN
jgi:glycosyltransferase involved in cell wall biosynthesis